MSDETDLITAAAKQMMKTQLEWAHYFGETDRVNGTKMQSGHVRDTFDTGEQFNNVQTVKTRTGYRIELHGDNAEVIFGENSTRKEFGDFLIEEILSEMAGNIVERIVRDKFED